MRRIGADFKPVPKISEPQSSKPKRQPKKEDKPCTPTTATTKTSTEES